jgi:diacylglycerol kinase family enzyme
MISLVLWKFQRLYLKLAKLLLKGQVQRIDLGWVNGKHFFNVASLGLSVQITQLLTKETKRRWGIFAYAVTALQAIWQTRPFSAEIRLNGNSIRVKTFQIAVGNGRYYGGGMAVVTMQQLMIKG